jgi:hypothetical protein
MALEYNYEEALKKFKAFYFYNLKENPVEDNEKTYEKYLKNLEDVKNVYEVENESNLFEYLKTTVDNYKTRNKTHDKLNSSILFMNIHGGIRSDFFTVPENIVVVLLTPINRSSGNQICFYNIKQKIVKYLKENFINILNNVICLDKGSNEKLFKESIVLLPGQKCNNLILSTDNNKPDFCSITDINEDNEICRNITNFQTLLSNFCDEENRKLDLQKIKLIIVNSCRSVDNSIYNGNIKKNIIDKIYYMENFIYYFNPIIFNCDTELNIKSLKSPFYYASSNNTKIPYFTNRQIKKKIKNIIYNDVKLFLKEYKDKEIYENKFQDAGSDPLNYIYFYKNNNKNVFLYFLELYKVPTNTLLRFSPTFLFPLKKNNTNNTNNTYYFPEFNPIFKKYNDKLFYISRIIKTICLPNNCDMGIMQCIESPNLYELLKENIIELNELILLNNHSIEKNPELKLFLNDMDKLNNILNQLKNNTFEIKNNNTLTIIIEYQEKLKKLQENTYTIFNFETVSNIPELVKISTNHNKRLTRSRNTLKQIIREDKNPYEKELQNINNYLKIKEQKEKQQQLNFNNIKNNSNHNNVNNNFRNTIQNAIKPNRTSNLFIKTSNTILKSNKGFISRIVNKLTQKKLK